MSNVDQQKFKIEDEAQKLQAAELVKQFKVEMGLAAPQAAPASAEKTIAAKESQRTS
jgi:phage shock protein A